jgi:hypothetical protein
MRFRMAAMLLVAGTAVAHELPKFQLDVNQWRQSLKSVPTARPPAAPRQGVVHAMPPRCAIRLQEVRPLAVGRIPIVTPEAGRKFAASVAKLPAEACESR